MRDFSQRVFSGFAGKIGIVSLMVICLALFSATLNAQTVTVAPVCQSLTSGSLTYFTNFNSLAASGMSSVVPPGFGFSETGTSTTTVNGQYTAATGSATSGDTYSFGTVVGDTDRAFGSIQSGSNTPLIGACFVNNTGSAISSLAITYDGEQYRLGATGRQDRLDFQYSVDPVATLISGTYTNFDNLDFLAPVTTGTAGAIDGNGAGKVTVSSTIPTLNIANGATFYVRYVNFDASGADDGLAIDNFSLTATLAGPTAAMVNVGGRVTNSKGRGISRALVTMTNGNGNNYSAYTDSSGNYLFEEVEVGQTLIFNVQAKRYNFTQPTQVVSLTEETITVNFTGYDSRRLINF